MSDNIPSMEEERARRRIPRWLWVLLIVSLCLNLLMIGAIGGTLWAVRYGGMWDAPVVAARTWQFMRRLPPEKRREVRELLQDYRSRLEPQIREVRRARMEIVEVVRAPSFDEAAFKTAYARLSAAENALRQAAQGMFAVVLDQLPPAERIEFLKIFARRAVEVRCSQEGISKLHDAR